MKCWLLSFLLIYPMPSTISCQYFWGISITFLFLYQIGTAEPAFSLPGRCYPDITNIIGAYITFIYSGIWTQALEVMQICLQFVPYWYWWTVITNNTKQPDRLWVDLSGSLMLILFPSLSWKLEVFKLKTSWSEILMVFPWKLKSLLSPFNTWGITGDPM